MTISEKIFCRLEELNMSQSEFSRQTGIATSTINDWKKKNTNPTAEKISVVCKVLKISFSDLLCEDDSAIDFMLEESDVIEFIQKSDIKTQKRLLEYLVKATQMNK